MSNKIILEDFSEGDGYYKVDLAYLTKEQVEEIEALVSKWKPTDEDIKACIGMCLTDVNEQKFKDYGTNLRDCLDWLENQGKQKPQKALTWKHWENGIAGNGERNDTFLIKWGPGHYSVSSYLGSKCDYIELSELDKLLRKPSLRERYDKIKDSEWFKKTHEGMSVSKESIEPKPKFHEGEWIVSDYNNVAYIESISETTYILRCKDGYHENMSIEYIDKCWHKWTIQDAKDGDVLISRDKEDILIYKSYSVIDLLLTSYISFNKKEGFCPRQYSAWDSNEFIPATKEQRDQLEKATTDAGYTFDFEKKELKSLITNGGDFESENCDGEDYGIDGLWHAKNILEETIGKVDGYQTDDGILEHKCAIEVVNKLYKQKPVWNEEDERICQCLIRDQEEALDDVYNDKYGHSEIISDLKEMYRERINWLKTLKQKIGWKPSKEQMNALDSTLQYSQVSFSSHQHLNSLYNDLKKLTE